MSYETAPGIRRSDLWLINRSPYHFKYAMDNEREQTKAMAFGSAIHAFILEPKTFSENYAVAPLVDRRTKDGKAEWQDFIDACEETGAEPISSEDMKTIIEMAAALEKNEVAMELLEGRHEQELFWTDERTGERCKCKVDCITEYNGKPYIVDYKTTDSCEDGHFERSAKKYGYQFQAGMYCEGVFQNTFIEHGFVFVAQEKTAPYASRVYFCDPDWIKRGYDKFRELIGTYHECKERDEWPGYENSDLTEV